MSGKVSVKKRILIKIGGRAFADEDGFRELAAAVQNVDADVVIVHGGGAEISQALKDAKRETVFVDGVRVTQQEDVDIVERVLSETVNSRIADYLQKYGAPVQRMSGKTDALLIDKRTLRNGKDIGLVGEIVQVNPRAVFAALDNGRSPVVSPISADESGVTFNVNADSAAAALAVGAQCSDLVYFSDVPGVLDEQRQLVPSLSVEAGKFLMQTGIISGGMVAKMESIIDAIENGVERVHITQWQGADTLKNLGNGGGLLKTTIHK